jgi:hypothetical protein
MATGKITVLDVDPDKDGRQSLQGLESRYGELPATWRSITGGGGEHIYFTSPNGHKIHNSVQLIGPGLDIRGVSGYVVAPPSVHISGRPYAWSVDHHPDEVQIALMPEWLRAAASAQLSPMSGTKAIEHAEETKMRARQVAVWRQLVKGVSEGARNDTLARLSGHLLRKNVDAFVVLELMKALNASRFQPPLSDREVTRTVVSIAGRELRRRGAR